MRELKESGIEWIGKIPKNWHLLKLKYFAEKAERGTSPEYTEDENMTRVVNQATFSKGVFDTSKQRYSTKPAETSRGLLVPGDVLVASTGGGVLGKTYYFDEPDIYVADGHVTIVRVKPTTASSKYLRYYLSVNYETINVMFAEGSTNQTELQGDLFNNMLFPFPPLPEQHAIATHLDRKCSEIDRIATGIQAEIETLESVRTTAISEAVTHGLDKTIPMRESGARWCMTIPAHWEMIPSKYLFHNSDLRKQEGDEQLTASQKYGIITQEDYMERENASIVLANKGLEDWKHVEPYDFIISLRSFQGGLEMSEVTGCITWHYIVLKPSRPICHRYYKWLFKSAQYINALQGTCNFIRDGQDLRFSNFAQVPLFVPPMEEQEAIADYLDQKTVAIDAAIEEKTVQLTTLEEYKKSLIFEYVTGKKEVPA